MTSLMKLVEMLQRAKEGPACSIREWDIKVIPQSTRKYLKKYELEHTFNREEPVNQDLSLADRFFEAGLEMAAEIGLLCLDTETIINVGKEEILQALSRAPDSLILGEGLDQITLKTRYPEDKNPPVFAGPLCIQVDEELYIPITQGVLKSKKVRIQQGPSLDTVFGYPVYSGTPYETVVALLENRLRKEAQWRAGREGIPNMSIGSSTTEYGQLGGFAGQTEKTNPSFAIILHPSGLRLGYASFHKAAAAIGYNGYIDAGSPSMIGGYCGGAEGATIECIANILLQFPIMQADMTPCTFYDIRNDTVCGRHGLWALSTACQAIARNTHTIHITVINQSAGPCTEEILYTSAAGLITAAVSGMTSTIGVRSAGGRFKNYLSPLEHWFCASTYEAAAGMSLKRANELVLYLLSHYEGGLTQTPRGKSFTECFDIKTLQPTLEWAGIAERVQKDLADRGMMVEW